MNREDKILVRKRRKVSHNWRSRKSMYARERGSVEPDYENAPIREPMRKSNKTRSQQVFVSKFYERLNKNPLRNFLYRNIGLLFDDLYAEYIRKIPLAYRHTVHVDVFVEKHVYIDEKERVFAIRNDRMLHEGRLFVHPDKGTLEMVEWQDAWQGINIPDYSKTYKGQQSYTIQQIQTRVDLRTEGREQRHCVYSYYSLCQMNKTSIWSMSVADKHGTGITRLLTIEVSPMYEIVQIKGQNNRLPFTDELKIVKEWALLSGLRIHKLIAQLVAS